MTYCGVTEVTLSTETIQRITIRVMKKPKLSTTVENLRPQRTTVAEKDAVERMKQFPKEGALPCHCSNRQELRSTYRIFLRMLIKTSSRLSKRNLPLHWRV